MPILPPTHTHLWFLSQSLTLHPDTHTTQHDKTQTHMVRQGMRGASHKMWAYRTLNQHTTHAVPRYYSSGCSVCNIMACLFICERPLCTPSATVFDVWANLHLQFNPNICFNPQEHGGSHYTEHGSSRSVKECRSLNNLYSDALLPWLC